MSLLKQIKDLWSSRPENKNPEVDALRNIISKVESLPPERARYLACFAFLLGRVAYADLNASAEEVDRIEKLIEERFGIETSQAILICNMAKTQNELFGSTENYLVAREFKDIATMAERKDLIDFLFKVAAADSAISTVEEAEIAQIAHELDVHKDVMIEIRGRYRDQRDVFRR